MIEKLLKRKNGRTQAKLIELPDTSHLTPQEKAEQCGRLVEQVCQHFGCEIRVFHQLQVVVKPPGAKNET